MGEFLSLVSLAALVIAGIGIGNGVSSYLTQRRQSIAMLKVLGATSGLVTRVYLLQVIAVGCCLAGWWGAEDHGVFQALRGVVNWSGCPPLISVPFLAAAPLLLAALTWSVFRAKASSDDPPAPEPARRLVPSPT